MFVVANTGYVVRVPQSTVRYKPVVEDDEGEEVDEDSAYLEELKDRKDPDAGYDLPYDDDPKELNFD